MKVRLLVCVILMASLSLGAEGQVTAQPLAMPRAAPQALPAFVSVVAGGTHTCALTTGGGVKCWGANNLGQLGDGTLASHSVPVDVSGLTSGVTALAAGESHTCALTAGGGIKCWGSNSSGQLGIGIYTSYNTTPVDVSGLTSGVIVVAAGNGHTCALTTSGGVKCWGSNFLGALGDGTTYWRPSPGDVSGLTSGVTALAAGWYFNCALMTGGGLKCWGDNYGGQLGDGTNTSHSVPVDVIGLTNAVTALAAGDSHICALTIAGGVKCWGQNGYGQLGDGTTTPHTTPTDVGGLTSGVSALTAHYKHTCAITTAGGAKCWGRNDAGQLGDGTTTARNLPGDVSGLTSGVTALAAGDSHTCAVLTGGGIKCWGENSQGQLGDGITVLHSVPVEVSTLTNGMTAIAAGGYHTCAVTVASGVKCWGVNLAGQLGDGTTTQRNMPVDVNGLTTGVTALATGWGHTCVLTTLGGVKCWGRSASGELGDGTTVSSLTPVDVSGLTSGVTALAARENHTCALTTSGGVKCWGYNSSGQLGDGTNTNRYAPVDVSGLTSGVTALAAGSSHTCALTTGGGVKCWGGNWSGQLGDGTNTNRYAPVDVSGLTSGVTALATGATHTCAVTGGGSVKCWGENYQGQLGDGTTINHSVPTDVSGLPSNVSTLVAGYYFNCALITGGGVKCWGYNASGQLGDGTTANRSAPVDVSGLTSNATMLAAGFGHTCGLTVGGRVKCWGTNSYSQLGLGTVLQQFTPVDVVEAPPTRVALGYFNGEPGSYLSVTGEGYPPGAVMTVTVNSQVLTTTLPVNMTGEFTFFLSTVGADAGFYQITVGDKPNASAIFVLDVQAPLRVQEGGGVTMAVPPGIGLEPNYLYLPLIQR